MRNCNSVKVVSGPFYAIIKYTSNRISKVFWQLIVFQIAKNFQKLFELAAVFPSTMHGTRGAMDEVSVFSLAAEAGSVSLDGSSQLYIFIVGGEEGNVRTIQAPHYKGMRDGRQEHRPIFSGCSFKPY